MLKRDPWQGLSRYTPARIALGRAGGSLRTTDLLAFRLAHARAKDAVEVPLSTEGLATRLAEQGLTTLSLSTLARDRKTFLLRPDHGRTLSDEARARLDAQAPAWGARDLVIIVSDGLSALAAERQVPPLLAELVPRLVGRGVSIVPVLLVPYARVKLSDEIGERLGAKAALMLIGERPGLSAPDSLGAYLTFHPRAACTDADRNCVSNIRPEGLPSAAAADKLVWLVMESARRGLSGVALKDEAAVRSLPTGPGTPT